MLSIPILMTLLMTVKIEVTFVNWAAFNPTIERKIICEHEIKIAVFDSRGRREHREELKPTTVRCKNQNDEIEVSTLLEYVQADDLLNWHSEEGEFYRVYSSLWTSSPQKTSIFEHYQTQSLEQGKFVYRVAPNEFVMLTCDEQNCRAEGSDRIYRAIMTIKRAN